MQDLGVWEPYAVKVSGILRFVVPRCCMPLGVCMEVCSGHDSRLHT